MFHITSPWVMFAVIVFCFIGAVAICVAHELQNAIEVDENENPVNNDNNEQ